MPDTVREPKRAVQVALPGIKSAWPGHESGSRRAGPQGSRLLARITGRRVEEPDLFVKDKMTLGKPKWQPECQRGRPHLHRALLRVGKIAEACRFERCGHRLMKFECTAEGRRFAIAESCRSRVCDQCQQREAFKRKRKLKKLLRSQVVKPGERLMMLTLTIRTDGTPIGAADVKRMFKYVRRFLKEVYPQHVKQTVGGRRRKVATGIRIGAIGVAEIGQNWNLHAHVVMIGPYVKQADMAAKWLEITGDSYIVDVRAVHGVNKSVGYICKYLAKVPGFLQESDYVPYVASLKGVRRVHTFGSWYNSPTLRHTHEKMKCPFCGEGMHFVDVTDQWDNQPRYSWWAKKLREPEKIDNWVWNMLTNAIGVTSDASWAVPESFADGFYSVDKSPA